MMRDLKVSDIVVSLAGHDSGKLFVVVSTEPDFVYLVDGKERKLQKPKRKKRKHVRLAGQCDSPLAEKLISGGEVTDSYIRKALAIVRASAMTEEGK